MDTKDWIFAGLALLQVIYAALAYHRAVMGKARHPFLVMASFMLLTWAVAGIDIYDRHFHVPTFIPGLVQGYGHTPPKVFFMNVDGSKVYSFHSSHKLMMIVRAVFADVDRMTDRNIEKTGVYTITNSPLTLAVVTTGKMKLAALAPNTVEYNLILLPSNVPPDRITDLEDVEQFGGKILANTGQTVFGGPPDNSSDLTGAIPPPK